jgi:hypothetical protein
MWTVQADPGRAAALYVGVGVGVCGFVGDTVCVTATNTVRVAPCASQCGNVCVRLHASAVVVVVQRK